MKLSERNNVLESLVLALRENHKESEEYTGILFRFDRTYEWGDKLPNRHKFREIAERQHYLIHYQFEELDKISEKILDPDKVLDIDKIYDDLNRNTEMYRHYTDYCYKFGKEFPEFSEDEIFELKIPYWARNNYYGDLQRLKTKHEEILAFIKMWKSKYDDTEQN